MNNSYDHDSHVFIVTAQGYAGDHLFSWFCKALNAHPEILCYLANEGSRPKYFRERSRAERPDLVLYVKFLSDVGRTYTAIGDCYSYRVPQLHVLPDHFGKSVRFVNLIRHPIIWSYFYVKWRASNLRMPDNNTMPLDHEWNIVDHSKFRGLKPYEKKDVYIWAFYRAMEFIDTHHQADLNAPYCRRHIPIEQLTNDRVLFQKVVCYLTHNRVYYNNELLDLIYSWLSTPFRGEDPFDMSPEDLWNSWQDWQKEAFFKLVRKESIENYIRKGRYDFSFIR